MHHNSLGSGKARIIVHIITMTKQDANARNCPAPQGDGAPVISETMVAAGLDALWSFEPGYSASREVVVEIFSAMVEASRSPRRAVPTVRRSSSPSPQLSNEDAAR